MLKHTSKRMIFIPVVTAALIKNGKVLLTRRVDKKVKFNGKWQLPGGVWEPNETIEQALKREIKEELGIDLKHYVFVPKIFEEFRKTFHLIIFVFTAKFPEEAKVKLNEEADEYDWFTLEEIKNLDALPYTYETSVEALRFAS